MVNFNDFQFEIPGAEELEKEIELARDLVKECFRGMYRYGDQMQKSDWEQLWSAVQNLFDLTFEYKEKVAAYTAGDNDPRAEYHVREELSDEDLILLEMRRQLTEFIDNSDEEKKYQELRTLKQNMWSFYQEEMDFNWLEVDVFEDKLERRLIQLEAKGEQPTEEQWEQAMKMLKIRKDRVVKYYESPSGEMKVDFRGFQGFSWMASRNMQTYPLMLKAQQATQDVRDFWQSEEGKRLTEWKDQLAIVWDKLRERDLIGRDWELDVLLNEALDPYWIRLSASRFDIDKIEPSESDKAFDLPKGFYLQLEGLPSGDEYLEILSYSVSSSRKQASEEEVTAWFKKRHEAQAQGYLQELIDMDRQILEDSMGQPASGEQMTDEEFTSLVNSMDDNNHEQR